MRLARGSKVRLAWRTDSKDPPTGTLGIVRPLGTCLPGKRGPAIFAGPLVYVQWSNGQHCGVLRGQLERVT